MNDIELFLQKYSKFPNIYHSGLEVQINVSQGRGTAKGRGFTDDTDFWYNLRISKLGIKPKYDLEKYVEAIGLSGWNFLTKRSEYVGFDFDSLIGHKSGLSDSELLSIQEKVKEITWIEIRKSTSGRGLHLYVFLEFNEEVCSRKEHSTLAKAVLKSLSGFLGIEIKDKVDKAGGILWVWSKKATEEGFELVKKATEKFSAIPKDWKTECKEFKGTIQGITQTQKLFTLNKEHRDLLEWFAKQKTTWWWDSELNMLVCHTFDLLKAHKELKMKGVFFTNATGEDVPNDQNCFAFPIKNGVWVVRRHTPGCKEHSYWQQDKSGWTYCYLNKIPVLQDLASIFGGQESAKNEYIFSTPDQIPALVKTISPQSEFSFPPWAYNRKITLRPLKNSKVSIKFERSADDPLLQGWIANRNNFERIIGIIEEEQEVIIPDNLLRHVVASGKDSGWFLFSKSWVQEPKHHISSALSTLGYNKEMIERTLGQCILNPWELVNQPFDPEYPGGRKWNKFSPQLLFTQKEGSWSYWKAMLEHLGENLNPAIKDNTWCQAYNIQEGWEYLLLWVAGLFQCPLEPLPYLFFFGQQLSGKSSFHEALSMLVNKGIVRADRALTNPTGFNGELAGAILCIIEETNLNLSKVAYNRVKDWVTCRSLPIREMFKCPFELPNSSHWIQCANPQEYCPVSFGDTRIVMTQVDLPEFIKPKEQFFQELREQAPAFLFEIFNKKIPPAIDRMRIPVLETTEKMDAQAATSNVVERFILEKCFLKKGHYVLLADFVHSFRQWLSQNGIEAFVWSPKKITASIPIAPEMPVKGRYGGRGDIHLGNISFDPDAQDLDFVFIRNGDRIVKKEI